MLLMILSFALTEIYIRVIPAIVPRRPIIAPQIATTMYEVMKLNYDAQTADTRQATNH